MASNAPTTIASTASIMTVRSPPEALQRAPLPLEREEMGHGMEEGVGSSEDVERSELSHPDGHTPPTTTDGEHTTTRSISPPSATILASHPSDSTSTFPSDKRSIISLLTRVKIPHIFGIQIGTLILFILQLALFGGTLATWILAVRIKRPANVDANSANIFVHVLFAVAVFGQVLLLERRVFRLRAERYSHLHPAEMLPSHHRYGSPEPPIGFAPWNRPTLPTYATALAASGHSTGDIDDHIIAAPPPPAYGNTRGSTLLLSSDLRRHPGAYAR